jgi:predicted permease
VLNASRVDLTTALKDSGAESTSGSVRHHRQSALVVVEMTLAIVLLAGAGLLVRTFIELRTVDRGFDPNGVLTLEMPLTDARFQNTAAVNELVRDARRRLEAVAGTGAMAASYSLPFEATVALPFTLNNRPLLLSPYHGVGHWRTVSPGYFAALRIRLVRGRAFVDEDDARGQRVVVINQVMARKFWQDRDPVGEQIVIGKSADREFDELPRFIIGVVGDARDIGLHAEPEPMMYVPLAQTSDHMTARNNRFFALTWVVRVGAERGPVRQTIEQELRAASGGLPIARVRTMQDIVRAATAQLEFTTILLSVFAAAALVLASIGIYGLMSYSVEQRRREIGIRMALGAEPGSLRNMVLAQGAGITAVGVGIGVAGALAASHVMRSLVVGLAGGNSVVLASVAALLGAIALAAVYIPAVEATRVDPVDVLKR